MDLNLQLSLQQPAADELLDLKDGKVARCISTSTSENSRKSAITCDQPSLSNSKAQTTMDSVHENRGYTRSCLVKMPKSGELPDDFIWCKYGQKTVKGHKYPRSYYRCKKKVTRGCLAQRRLETWHEDDSKVLITYRGEHTCLLGPEQEPFAIRPERSDNKRLEAMSRSVQSRSPSPSDLSEGILDDCVESSTKALGFTSQAFGMDQNLQNLQEEGHMLSIPLFSQICLQQPDYQLSYLKDGSSFGMDQNLHLSLQQPAADKLLDLKDGKVARCISTPTSENSRKSTITCDQPSLFNSKAQTTMDSVHENRGYTKRIRRLPKYTFKVPRDIVQLDGYIWRKKIVQRLNDARTYYRCAKKGCKARKRLQTCDEDDSLVLVTYIGKHTCKSSENASGDVNQPKAMSRSAQSNQNSSPSPRVLSKGIEGILDDSVESSAKALGFTGQAFGMDQNLQNLQNLQEEGHMLSIPLFSRICLQQPDYELSDLKDGKVARCISTSTSENNRKSTITCDQPSLFNSKAQTTMDSVHENRGYRKRRLPMAKFTLKIPRHKSGELADGYIWCKYGEKTVKGHTYPRSYYRCEKRDEMGCPALQQVETCDEDDSLVLVTYIGEHTCQSSVYASSDNKRPEAMSCSVQRRSASPSVLSEGILDDSVESSAKALGFTSSEHVEMTSHIEFVEALNEPAMCDAIMEPYNIEKPDEIHLLLALENTHLGESIFVGAVVHAIPSEYLEFFFFNAKDMASCVGIGLPQAKVILHTDLSIIIEETTVSERQLKDTWMPFLSDSSCHLVMKVKMEASGMQVNGDVNVQAFVSERAETLSQLYGVGFDCGSQYVDETYDAAEVSWPLLYDMALFILTANDVQCNETKGNSSAQESGSFQGNNPDNNNMVHKLHGKHDSVLNRGNLQGGGDGDEDEFGCNHNVSRGGAGDDPPVVLKVTVHPLTKCDILDTQLKPYGLEGASIAPNLVFEFRQNCECKRISIKSQTRLELASQMDVFYNTNLFGWYHTGIQISFGCEDTEGHLQSGRVALLKQNSCRILNPKTSYKYTAAKSIMSTKADTYTAGGQAGLKVSNAWLGGIELQGSSSGSRMQQVATCNGENIEIARECICEGFSFRDSSSTEFPARANFFLFYPLDNLNIWGDREFLQGQGLFATIEPCIEGTWIPLNGLDASPYLFKAVRSLKFHTRVDGLKDHVLEHKQEYVLPFYVNHAMSHLKSQRSKHIELFGDQQFIPDVIRVGSVY